MSFCQFLRFLVQKSVKIRSACLTCVAAMTPSLRVFTEKLCKVLKTTPLILPLKARLRILNVKNFNFWVWVACMLEIAWHCGNSSEFSQIAGEFRAIHTYSDSHKVLNTDTLSVKH
jgi:hypothetical protein